MLDTYQKDTTRLMRDFNQTDVDPRNILNYINIARRDVAGRSQCIRRLTPVSGGISTITLDDGGSNYSASPTITISGPDFPSGLAPNPTGLQAEAVATVIGGVIQSIDVTVGGSGYFQPTVTIEDSTGSGASGTCVVEGLNVLNIGQEVYNFADINLETFPGVGAVLAVKSPSIIYSNMRYIPVYRSFTVYQARYRSYTQQYQYTPMVYSQFGQGTEGSLYFYPYPSQILQVEYDCLCLPSDLTTDGSYEAIPDMWRDAVKYFAANLAYTEIQNYNAAAAMMAQYNAFMKSYGDYARPGMATNQYGGGRW